MSPCILWGDIFYELGWGFVVSWRIVGDLCDERVEDVGCFAVMGWEIFGVAVR